VTEPRFLLDSNILIYMMAGRPLALRKRLEQQQPGALVTSMICVAEVLVGTDDPGRLQLNGLLSRIPPLPFGMEAAEAFATVPFGRGRFDRLIAAHALASGTILVTANLRDFEDVPGLAVENWTK
jgi:tRNA(fMet)-specific endonuclease VapC